jgi:hypothetical protein
MVVNDNRRHMETIVPMMAEGRLRPWKMVASDDEGLLEDNNER